MLIDRWKLQIALALALFVCVACGPNTKPYKLAHVPTSQHQYIEHGVYLTQPNGFKQASAFSGFSNSFGGSISVKLTPESVASIAKRAAFERPKQTIVRFADVLDSLGNPNGGFYAEIDDDRRGVYRYKLAFPRYGPGPAGVSEEGYALEGLTVRVEGWYNKQYPDQEKGVEATMRSVVFTGVNLAPKPKPTPYAVVDLIKRGNGLGVRYAPTDTSNAADTSQGTFEVYDIPTIPKRTGLDYVQSEIRKLNVLDAVGGYAALTRYDPPYRFYSASRERAGGGFAKVVLIEDTSTEAETQALMIFRMNTLADIDEAERWMMKQMFTTVIQ